MFISCKNDSMENKSAGNIQLETNSNPQQKLNHFFFVGNYGGQSSIYKFKLNDNTYKIFWYSPKETVIKYLHTEDFRYAYFLTARKIGSSRGMSYIRSIRLYRLDPESLVVEQVSHIGDAIQIYAQWIEMNINIQLTRFDLKIASHINKINQLYSPFGKLLKEDVEAFDFINDRYPQFDIGNISFLSPSGNFGVTQSADSIYLKITGDEQKIYIYATAESINKVNWSSSERHIIFTAYRMKDAKDEKGNSIICVYNLQNQIIERLEESTVNMDFIIIDNLVIFENRANNNSFLTVYNFEKSEEVYRINIPGGCRLSSIPGV